MLMEHMQWQSESDTKGEGGAGGRNGAAHHTAGILYATSNKGFRREVMLMIRSCVSVCTQGGTARHATVFDFDTKCAHDSRLSRVLGSRVLAHTSRLDDATSDPGPTDRVYGTVCV